MPMPDDDLLRRAFDVADRALERGNHPFGAVLAGPDEVPGTRLGTSTPWRGRTER